MSVSGIAPSLPRTAPAAQACGCCGPSQAQPQEAPGGGANQYYADGFDAPRAAAKSNPLDDASNAIASWLNNASSWLANTLNAAAGGGSSTGGGGGGGGGGGFD